MSDFYTDLENRLSKVSGPAMPADMESRIRQRLSAQTAKPRRRWIGFLPVSPAFAAQAATLAALIAIAAALIAHDWASNPGNNVAPPAGISAGPTTYVATFSVPTIKSSGPAPVENTIAPPLPPKKHH